jgi:hypothetical protein
MELIFAKLDEIKESKYNPPVRTKSVSRLMKNIAENGLLTPILVDNKYIIIDGHRRKKAAELLEMNEVPVIVHDGTSSRKYSKLFVATSQDTMMIGGSQWLWMYTQGRDIPEKHLFRIKKLEEYLGPEFSRGMFMQLIKKNRSASTYQNVMGMYRKYTNKRTKAHMKALAYYLLNVDSCFKLKNALVTFIPINLLTKCIEQKKKINVVWETE